MLQLHQRKEREFDGSYDYEYVVLDPSRSSYLSRGAHKCESTTSTGPVIATVTSYAKSSGELL